MSIEKVLTDIQHQSPRLVYLSGKTCTGKTTFANFLEQHSYRKIELDNVVTKSVVIPFNVPPGDGFRTAYRDTGPAEQTAAFIAAAKTEILFNLKESSLVIEGAIAKSRILKELFTDELKDFVFIYFHPVNIDSYTQRIESRFVAGAHNNTTELPKDFWASVQEQDLSEFKTTNSINDGIKSAIKEYAKKSMEESQVRLNHLKESFPDMVVVNF